MPHSQVQQYNYSRDYLKLAAFTDELNNYLNIIEQNVKDETSDKYYERQHIIEYFETRIKQLKSRTDKL
jgi:hypothetical protein